MSRALLASLVLIGWTACTADDLRDQTPDLGYPELFITSNAPDFVRDVDVVVEVVAPGRSLTQVEIAGEAATLAVGTGIWTATLSPADLSRMNGNVASACAGEDLTSLGGNTARIGVEVLATAWPGDNGSDLVEDCLVVAIDTTPKNEYDGISMVLEDPNSSTPLPRLLPNAQGLQALQLVVSTTDPSSVKNVVVEVTGGLPDRFTVALSQQPVARAVDVVAGQPLFFAKIDTTQASTQPFSLVAGPAAASADVGVDLGDSADVVFIAAGVIEECRAFDEVAGLTMSSSDLDLAYANAWKPRTNLSVTRLHRVTLRVHANPDSVPPATSKSRITVECRDRWDRRARATVTARPALPATAGLDLSATDEVVAPDEEVTLHLAGESAAVGLGVAWSASAGRAPIPIGPPALSKGDSGSTASARFHIPSDASGVITLSATVSSRTVDTFVQVAPDFELFPDTATLRPGQNVVIRGIDGLPDYTCSASVAGGEALSTDTSDFIRMGTLSKPTSTVPRVTVAAKDLVDSAARVVLRCSDDAGRSDTATVTVLATPKDP